MTDSYTTKEGSAGVEAFLKRAEGGIRYGWWEAFEVLTRVEEYSP